MADSDTESRPKNPGGSTDWETVFEDPETGLIPLIAQAHSASGLRECVIVVIKSLFTRKNDPSEVERFVAELTRIIPENTRGENLVLISKAVTGILRQIKEDRKAKAAEYEHHKEQAPNGEKRNLAERSGGGHRRFIGKRRSRASRWLAGMSLVGFVAATVLIIGYLAERGQRSKPEGPRYLLIEQMKRVARGEVIEQNAFGGTVVLGAIGNYKGVVANGIPAKDCASAGWVFANRGSIVINGLAPTKISPNILTKLCSASPHGATLAWIPKADWNE